MKYLKLFAISIFFGFGLFFTSSAEAACVTMNVDFSSTGNWPAGETVTISCIGDNPPGPSNCVGDKDTIKPGEKKTLTQCTCPQGGGAPGSGCLVVESKPSQCTQPEVKKYDNYCQSNGNTVNAVLNASCQAAPTPTPKCGAPYCQDWDNPPQTCTKNGKTYYKAYVQCEDASGNPVRWDEQPCGSLAACEIPKATNTPTPTKTPTATPTSGPQCNTNCSGNPSICDQASGGCTYCNPNNNRCEVPPGTTPPTSTPTPTNPPGTTPPTATPTTPGGGTQPPTQPPSGPPTATSTPRPPTATPTPAFDENWCKCDTMSVSQLIGGQPAVFTATGKVEAPNTDKAKVQWIKFQVFEGLSKRIAESGQIPAQKISETTSLVRYQSQWTWTVPADIKKGVEYQAKATIKCAPTSTAINLPFTSIYMGVSDENQGLFGMIVNFFKNIFGGKKETPAPAQVTQEPLASMEQDEVSIAGDELQLGTVPVGKTIENTCSLIRFKFQ